MPSKLHENLIQMFRERPKLAAEMLAGPLRVSVPRFTQALWSSSDLPEVEPTEYRADAVVTLHHRAKAVMAIIIEVQLKRDQRKLFSWPVYVSTLRARMHCPVALVVLCADQAVASWCAGPVTIGPPGSVLTPIALGPRQVPVITDPETARQALDLAVLSAIVHGTEPEPTAIFTALLAALDTVDEERAKQYTDRILVCLPDSARKYLRELMTTTGYKFQSEIFAEGKASAVLTVLDARGVEVPESVRAEISGCTDVDQLETWVRLAATADKIEDLGLNAAQ